MRQIRTLFTILGAALIIGFGVATPVYAASSGVEQACTDAQQNGTGSPSFCTTKDPGADNPLYGSDGVINKIANFIAYIAGTVAVLMVIYGGFRYVISNGDSAKITSARQIITYSLVGLVIVVLAKVIVTFVLNQFA